MGNKALVVDAANWLFGKRELAAVDRYFAPSYVQHSAMAGPGLPGLRTLVENLPEDVRYDLVRVIGEGEFVVAHGIYHGFGPQPLVAFDLWRVENGLIAEHWDALQAAVVETASGRSMTDGPARVTEFDRTAENKEVVEQFVQDILVDGDVTRLTDFYDGDTYAQHNPKIADGLSGLSAALKALAEQGITMRYSRRHRTVAEGEFVFTQSEGTFAGVPTAFYDLFRVDNGKLAEHWDVVAEIPATLPHDNGLF